MLQCLSQLTCLIVPHPRVASPSGHRTKLTPWLPLSRCPPPGTPRSFGSVVSVMSTLFLMGPVKQCQRMLEEKRILATIGEGS